MAKYNMDDMRKHFSLDVLQLNDDVFGPAETRLPQELREQLGKLSVPRANKYGAKKKEVDGHVFDSQKEAARYLVLKAQEEAGEISDLILQHEIMLQAGFVYRGEKVQPITYSADFAFVENGILHIQDLKSVATAKTEAFRIRWRLLQWHFKDRDDVICEITLS